MVQLWHCLVRLWYRLPLATKVAVLVAGLMVTVAVTTSQVVLWRFAQDQKSHLELLTGAYLDSLSAAVLPALVRRDVRGVFDALDRAQGNRYADDFEPRFAILELPNRTIVASSDPRRFPVQSVVPEELRRRFAAGDGLEIDPNTDSAWLARTLRTEGSLVGRLFAEVDIAASLRVRREILITLVLVNGCLTLAFALGGYFVRKRMLRDAMANRPFLEGLRRGTAGRLANLATWIVIGLLLVALFNLFQTSSSRGPQSTLAFSDFLNDVNRGQVSDVHDPRQQYQRSFHGQPGVHDLYSEQPRSRQPPDREECAHIRCASRRKCVVAVRGSDLLVPDASVDRSVDLLHAPDLPLDARPASVWNGAHRG